MTHEEVDTFLHSSYLPLVAKEPRKKREIIVCSDEIGRCVHSDEFFVFRAQDLKERDAFKFPVGHPQDGCVYIAHPLRQNTYYELNEFHNNLLREKQDELCYLIESLGASRIRVEVVQTTDVSREKSAQVSQQIQAGRKLAEGSIERSVATEQQERSSQYQRFCDDITLNPQGKPFIPDNLMFYPHEEKWQRIAKQALQRRYKEFSIELEYKTDYAINTKRVANLNAKVKTLLSKFKVAFNAESSTKLQQAMSTVLRYSAIFDPPATDAEVVAPAEPLPLLPAVGTEGLTEAEQTYIETVKDALADGAITPATRKILERTRTRLGLSPERAGELEQSLAAPALSQEEQAYYEDVKDALADGEIAGFARRMLDKRQKELGLTPEQAKAIEASLQGNS